MIQVNYGKALRKLAMRLHQQDIIRANIFKTAARGEKPYFCNPPILPDQLIITSLLSLVYADTGCNNSCVLRVETRRQACASNI